MKILVGVAVIALGIGVAAQEQKLGAGVSLKEATPVEAIIAKPADYVGKKVRVDGVATAVCEAEGCWIAVASAVDPKGPVVRFKVEDGVIKFPVSAKGKQVSAEGVVEEIKSTDDHSKEAAGEHAKHDAKASKKFQIVATGAVIR